MKIEVTEVTENLDGSADAVVSFDAEGLAILIQEGLVSIIMQSLDQAEKDSK